MIDDIREWISDNLRYILLGLAAVLIILMIVFVVRLVTRPSDSGTGKSAQTSGAPQQGGSVDSTQTGSDEQEGNEDVDTASTEAEDLQNSQTASNLVKDDAEILTLMREYYTARSSKDITTLSQIATPWNSSTQDNLLQADLIESYNEISTYSEPGLDEGSYVVFTCFMAKIPDFETLVPTMRRSYLVTEDGDLKVLVNYESDAEIASFAAEVTKDADVQQLINRVNTEYEQALNSDEQLKAYLNDLNTDASEDDDTQDEQQGEGGAGETRTALYALNIRETASTEANILGTVPASSEVTVLQDVEDGWSQISFDPGTGTVVGYVRTEYLG